ncbi:unnamed protein product [Protopolystoma xenopodis]|uniref:Dihydrolipoyllysine-residue succinyltransferase component of 2-oxoglutarate dehydrogenase complex, mitochondrial n=1 Tax=Protopolystoma xenopodis TaxID=117903 RepID=A0A3S4ZZ58_9PLAT|nr:unnamed protein product [Protopolystoma xenopodis]
MRLRRFHSTQLLKEFVTIYTPPFAESISEGDIRWLKSPGDFVNEDELVGEIETEKTTVPLPAPCSGVIKELLVADGSKVVAKQELCKMDSGTGAKPHTEKKPDSLGSPDLVHPVSSKREVVDSATYPPKETIISVVQPPTSPSLLRPKDQESPSSSSSALRGEERVKMNRMRRRIAQRLKESQNTCAMLTTFNEVDMSNLIELRNAFKEAFLKKHGVKLGIMSAFTKAAAIALTDQPIVNAVIDDTEIVYRDYIDISIAVATPKGLVVPVLRNVGHMNYADIERGINALGEKAKSGQLAVEDMEGGTFTISNGGVFGSLFGTPIINPPQSAILGLHGSFDRPVVRGGQVVIRPMMYLALTYDHRLIDGREAVTFLRKIKSFIEDPRIYFLQL